MNIGVKTYIILLVTLLVLTLCAFGFFTWYGQEYAPTYFMLIPAFYMIDGLWLSISAGKQLKKGKRIPVKQLILMRLTRIIGLIAILVLGIVLDRIHMLTYAILFAIFYIVYLVFETIVMKNSQQLKK